MSSHHQTGCARLVERQASLWPTINLMRRMPCRATSLRRCAAGRSTLRALRLPFATLLLPGSPFGALGLAFTALLLTLPLSVGAIAALRQLNSLARRLRGGGGNGGQDRRSDQQPSEHLFHYAILQFRSRALEKASRDDESLVTGGKMIGG